MNGAVVAVSQPQPLCPPSWITHMAFDVSIQLWRRPATLSIRIAECSGWAAAVLGAGEPLAEVMVPIPGGAAASSGEEGGYLMGAFEPIAGAFSFSASQPMVKPAWDGDMGVYLATASTTTANGGDWEVRINRTTGREFYYNT